MTFDDFIAELRRDVEDFEAGWRLENGYDPDAYPMEMLSGDWDEQFSSFRVGDQHD